MSAPKKQGLRAANPGRITFGNNPRLAAVGQHALVDGLIVNWVLDPAYLPLARDAKTLVDQYLERLSAGPVKAAPRSMSSVMRRARAEARG